MSNSEAQKQKILCILHRPPPGHGASKVGDFIANSKELNDTFDCNFITIKASYTIEEVGKFNLRKVYLATELYIKILWALLVFRPQKIYFTASIKSFAFYRDLTFSILFKIYKKIKPAQVYYHYHTKGVNSFVSTSQKKLWLTRFFIKDVNIILLSPLLKPDFDKVQTYRQVLFLPNGVEDNFESHNFDQYVTNKYKQVDCLQVLFLSNMIKSKGYFEVLKLAKKTKKQNIHYHFAGAWRAPEDEEEFFSYIKQNKLSETVSFHGYVNDEGKHKLFKKCHLLLFPTRYKKETFGLVLIEAFSYGIPVISTNEGSIPRIVDKRSGIILKNVEKLPEALERIKDSYINTETASYCRKRFVENYTLQKFESNLLDIFTAT